MYDQPLRAKDLKHDYEDLCSLQNLHIEVADPIFVALSTGRFLVYVKGSTCVSCVSAKGEVEYTDDLPADDFIQVCNLLFLTSLYTGI
jgi:hypothetical protein